MQNEYESMERLTTPDGNYCRDICGMVKTCKRLKRGELRCKNALVYERLQKYENGGVES